MAKISANEKVTSGDPQNPLQQIGLGFDNFIGAGIENKGIGFHRKTVFGGQIGANVTKQPQKPLFNNYLKDEASTETFSMSLGHAEAFVTKNNKNIFIASGAASVLSVGNTKGAAVVPSADNMRMGVPNKVLKEAATNTVMLSGKFDGLHDFNIIDKVETLLGVTAKVNASLARGVPTDDGKTSWYSTYAGQAGGVAQIGLPSHVKDSKIVLRGEVGVGLGGQSYGYWVERTNKIDVNKTPQKYIYAAGSASIPVTNRLRVEGEAGLSRVGGYYMQPEADYKTRVNPWVDASIIYEVTNKVDAKLTVAKNYSSADADQTIGINAGFNFTF